MLLGLVICTSAFIRCHKGDHRWWKSILSPGIWFLRHFDARKTVNGLGVRTEYILQNRQFCTWADIYIYIYNLYFIYIYIYSFSGMRNLWGGALVLVQNKWITASMNTLLQQQVWFPVGKALLVRLKVLRRSMSLQEQVLIEFLFVFICFGSTLVIPVLSWTFYESASFSTSGLAVQHLLLVDLQLAQSGSHFFPNCRETKQKSSFGLSLLVFTD